ncbi:MAG: ABC transporter permease [Alistipes sp.]|nr:ABC transporter permease [Alistipes sp.]
MTLIWKLLRKHISIFELAVFFVANLIGMAVILAGVQIYSDIKPMLTGEKSLIGNEYVIVTRPVERVGIGAPTFSAEAIEEFREQDFVLDLGLFAASQFEVDGSIMFNGRRLSTMMFFEAVPDSFIDVESRDWHFAEGDNTIPIILPRNYLNLYNFGFSQTQNLPQITEDMIKRVELGIRLSGNGHRDDYVGRVVGFSDRLNTILVPMEFMNWANGYYANASVGEPTRLILEVANPGAPEVTSFLAEHGYSAEDKPSESSKALFLLKVCVAVIVGIGLIFSLLSVIILTLSIYLLLQKNITKLENLVLIGYTPSRVAMPYNLMTLILNLSILAISLVVVFIAQGEYMGYLSDIAGHELTASPTTAIIVGILFTAVIIAFNFFIIYRKIREISKKR